MNSKTASYQPPLVATPGFDNTNETRQKSVASNSDITLEIVSMDEWDNLISNFGDAIPEQTGIFNISHWGRENIECVKVQRQGKLIGGAVLIVRKIPFSTTGLAVLKWGPVWCVEGSDRDEWKYSSVIHALIAEYCTKRNFHLTIMPAATPHWGEKACSMLNSLGFKTGNSLAAPERYLVNTDQNCEELMASLNQKWRYNLRKAHKNEFDIRFADDAHGLDTFLDLYSKMMDRKQFQDASAIGSLRDIMQNDNEIIRPRIVLVYHNANVTAGGIISTIGNMASYMFGASDDRALKLKAGYAMHWWIVEHLCNLDSTKLYDLGGNDLDAGLHQFKKGFVGKTGHILQAPPRYHFANSTIANITGTAVFRARDHKAAVSRMIHRVKNRAGK